MAHRRPTLPSSTPSSELATAIHLSLRAQKRSPAQVARLLFPPPRPGHPDRKAARRRALARQLTALLRQKPTLADLKLDTETALGLDRVLGLPTGYCALIATLDHLLIRHARKKAFHHRLAQSPNPIPHNVGYAVIVSRPNAGSVAFVDGRSPAD